MKRTLMIGAAALCCLLCLASLAVYVLPQGTQSVDWSLMPGEGQTTAAADWTVYVIRAGRRVLLEGENGRYAGCEPGETFYFSRTWDAQIAQPVLRIHAVMAAVAVWVDDDLVYTDEPLTEGIGEQISLPMLSTDRTSAVEVPLQGELLGHTLTIAQASPLESETGYAFVYPCDVQVTRAYAYERGLITQANRTGLMELALCGLAVLLCCLACKQGEGALLLLALLALLRLLGVIATADFFYQYTTLLGLDLGVLADRLSFSVMLGFLTCKCERTRWPLAAMAVLHALSAAAALLVQAIGLHNDAFVFISFLPDRLTLVCLAGAACLAAMQAKRRVPFFTLFVRLLLALSAAGVLVGAAFLLTHADTWARLLAGQVDVAILLRGAVVWVMQGAGIGTAVLLAVRQLHAAREERVFAAVRAQAVAQSYESLQRHQSEVMTLRHEMKRHDLALKGLLDAGDTARAKEYLADLLQEQEHLPQAVHTGNALMNILLGSRIAAAEGAGLRVELLRMDVPASLPLSDKETVSLVLNLLDNAIEAAQRTPEPPGLVRLDMHQKNRLFVFTCENSMPKDEPPPQHPPLDPHGYGLHIVEQILEPFGSLMTTQVKEGRYCVTVALPLENAAKAADTGVMRRSNKPGSAAEAPAGGNG